MKQPTSRAMAIVALAAVAVLGLGVLVSRDEPESYNAGIMVQVTEAMVDHGNVVVTKDDFGFNSPYSTYGIGFSLLMVPAAAVAKGLGADQWAAMMLTNPAVLAILAGVLLAWCRLAGARWRASLVTTGLVVFGSLLLPHAATGFSELSVALGVAIGLLAVEGAGRQRPWAGVLAGAGAGLAVISRTDSLVLVVPFLAGGTWWASDRSTRTLVHFGVALAPWLALWAGYNQYRFGAPWRLGYEGFGFTTPFMRGLYGLTASSGRGVLWFVPLVVVAAVGMRAAYRRSRAVALAACAMFLARPLFFASWSAWEGGVTWGPRFLVPAMPLLAVGVLEVVRHWDALARGARAGLALVSVASVAVQVVGVAVAYEVFYNEKVVPRAFSPELNVDFHLFGWRDSPILGETRYLLRGHGLASRFLSPDLDVTAVLVLVGVIVASGAAAWALAGRQDATVGVAVDR